MTIGQLFTDYGPFTVTFLVFASAGFFISRAALWGIMSLIKPWHWRSADELLGFSGSVGLLIALVAAGAAFSEGYSLVIVALASFLGNMPMPMLVLILVLIAKVSKITMGKIDGVLARTFGSLTDDTSKQ
ncbi:MAG TPA: hypothetical protein EYN91_21420 [Candidatus Melainabacteria bacterium]|jgi:hypothetical protein|nr:hypothetical protein [Candidatus Melainabacteria bacterium]